MFCWEFSHFRFVHGHSKNEFLKDWHTSETEKLYHDNIAIKAEIEWVRESGEREQLLQWTNVPTGIIKVFSYHNRSNVLTEISSRLVVWNRITKPSSGHLSQLHIQLSVPVNSTFLVNGSTGERSCETLSQKTCRKYIHMLLILIL